MALLFITGSALLFYSTSKYFPLSLQDKFALQRNLGRSIGGLFWIIGMVLFARSMSASTAVIVSLVTWMTILPMLIYSLTLYPKSWKGWITICVVIAVLDMIYYAG